MYGLKKRQEYLENLWDTEHLDRIVRIGSYLGGSGTLATNLLFVSRGTFD